MASHGAISIEARNPPTTTARQFDIDIDDFLGNQRFVVDICNLSSATQIVRSSYLAISLQHSTSTAPKSRLNPTRVDNCSPLKIFNGALDGNSSTNYFDLLKASSQFCLLFCISFCYFGLKLNWAEKQKMGVYTADFRKLNSKVGGVSSFVEQIRHVKYA